jgi:hypothetical protein
MFFSQASGRTCAGVPLFCNLQNTLKFGEPTCAGVPVSWYGVPTGHPGEPTRARECLNVSLTIHLQPPVTPRARGVDSSKCATGGVFDGEPTCAGVPKWEAGFRFAAGEPTGAGSGFV